MKLIIQIPCYNEAETLEIALNDLPKQIDGIDEIEYLIINDGSKDNTVEVAKNWGVNYVVDLKRNKGLAKGFMAGLDACLRNGADIIVNTDADNQYCADDIEKIVRPILEGKTDIVIGARPVDDTEHWSPLKKKLQHFGSWVVRKASRSDIPDALRPSRLFSSMFGYVKKSMLTILRAFMMYRPLMVFSVIGSIIFAIGLAIGVRFLVYYFGGSGAGHMQSLILASTLMLLGFQTFIVGLLADIISANRKILEDVQYHVRKLDFDRETEKKNEENSQEG